MYVHMNNDVIQDFDKDTNDYLHRTLCKEALRYGYISPNFEFEDAYNAGIVGYLEALERVDRNRDIREIRAFMMVRITGAIKDMIRRYSGRPGREGGKNNRRIDAIHIDIYSFGDVFDSEHDTEFPLRRKEVMRHIAEYLEGRVPKWQAKAYLEYFFNSNEPSMDVLGFVYGSVTESRVSQVFQAINRRLAKNEWLKEELHEIVDRMAKAA